MRFINLHGIGDPQGPKESRDYWVSEDAFSRVLDLVAKSDEDDLRLTFDDGFQSDHTIALPRLVDRDMKAAFFVSVGLLGRPGYLCASRLREMRAVGMDIGVHGWHHRPWRGLSDSELEIEHLGAKEKLEEILEDCVSHFACPFGSYDRRVLRSLQSAGAEKVLTSDNYDETRKTWLVPRRTMVRDMRVEDMFKPQAASALWLGRLRTGIKKLR